MLPPVTFNASHATLTVSRPALGVALVVIDGFDVGEFGDAPFRELERVLSDGGPVEIFVDARAVRGASIDVSAEWAQWMDERRDRIHRMNMLCGSRFIEVTARFVRRFTGFGERMRVYTDSEAFEAALRATIADEARGASRNVRTGSSM